MMFICSSLHRLFRLLNSPYNSNPEERNTPPERDGPRASTESLYRFTYRPIPQFSTQAAYTQGSNVPGTEQPATEGKEHSNGLTLTG